MIENEDRISLATIQSDLGYIKRDIAEIKQSLKEDYVRWSDFAPVKSIVYGLVGVALTAAAVAVVNLVIAK